MFFTRVIKGNYTATTIFFDHGLLSYRPFVNKERYKNKCKRIAVTSTLSLLFILMSEEFYNPWHNRNDNDGYNYKAKVFSYER
jgi:hypothetical protein